jgi:hypothetical protein
MSRMNFCKLSNLKKLAQSYLSLMLSTEYSRTIQTLNYLQDFYYRPKTQNTTFYENVFNSFRVIQTEMTST